MEWKRMERESAFGGGACEKEYELLFDSTKQFPKPD